MSPVQDITQFGLTKENNVIIKQLEELGFFPNQMEAAKFALSFAIRSGVQPGTISQAENKWHTGGFDQDGNLADVIRILFPEVQAPYRVIEYLVNSGLTMLGQHLAQNGTIDILSLTDETPKKTKSSSN